jgi:hypothetical protein
LSIAGRAVSRRAEAINQAIALQPDGIVLGTIDADEQAAVIGAAPMEGVVVVDRPAGGEGRPFRRGASAACGARAADLEAPGARISGRSPPRSQL